MIAAAVAPQVEVHDLEVLSQRPQGGLHREVIQAGAAVDGHQDRALYRRVPLRITDGPDTSNHKDTSPRLMRTRPP